MDMKGSLEKNWNLISAGKLLNGRGAIGWNVVIVTADPSWQRTVLGMLSLCPLTSVP